MNSFCKITALLIAIPLFSCSTGKNAAVEKQDNSPSVSSAAGSEENILPAESSGPDSKENIIQSETSDSVYGEKTAEPEINRSEPSKTPETSVDSASSGSPSVPEADKEAEALKASGTEGTALDVTEEDKDSEKVKAPAASGPDGRALKEQPNPAGSRSLPFKEGVGRTSGTGWAKKIADVKAEEKQPEEIEAQDAAGSAGKAVIGEKPDSDKAESGVSGEAGTDKAESGSSGEAGAEKAESISKKAGTDKERRSAPEKKIGKSGAAEKAEKIKASPLSASEIPAKAEEKADNGKKSPDYESKASEYLDTLEKEAENSSTADESGAGGLNGRKYVLSFKEGGNAEDRPSSQLKGGGAVSGKEGDNRAAEKADDASDRGSAGDSRGSADGGGSGESGRDSGDSEGGEGSGAGSIRNREKVLFDDPSHITVVLDGTGWIFTGEKDGKNITFLSRTVDGGKTVFSFRAGSGKVFVLNFQFQNTDGSSRRTDIELASRDSADGDNNRDSLLPEAEGKGREKDSDNVKNLPAVSPDSASGKSAENNLSSMKSSAENGAGKAELEESDINKLFEEALVLMENKEYGKASEKLEKIRKSPYQFPETDRLYFLLGQCSEKNEKNRDPVKAEMYYSMLLDQFPFSIYYDRAEKRKRYLLRYFINIK